MTARASFFIFPLSPSYFYSITRTFASGKTEKGIFQALKDLGLPSGKVRLRQPLRSSRLCLFKSCKDFSCFVFFSSGRTTRSSRRISPSTSSTRSRRRSALAPTSRSSSRRCESPSRRPPALLRVNSLLLLPVKC